MGIAVMERQVGDEPATTGADRADVETRAVMVYEDEEGEHREEPACPRCISRFAWKAEQKEVIGDVLRLQPS